MDLTFRRLIDDDLPLLHGWLNDPGVVQWWEGDDVSWDAIVRDYGSAATDPTEHWLAVAGDEPIQWSTRSSASDRAAAPRARNQVRVRWRTSTRPPADGDRPVNR